MGERRRWSIGSDKLWRGRVVGTFFFDKTNDDKDAGAYGEKQSRGERSRGLVVLWRERCGGWSVFLQAFLTGHDEKGECKSFIVLTFCSLVVLVVWHTFLTRTSLQINSIQGRLYMLVACCALPSFNFLTALLLCRVLLSDNVTSWPIFF